MTGNAIIAAALRKLGVLNVGSFPDASQQSTGLEALNDLLESLSIDRTTVFTESPATYTLTPNKRDYTIGIDPAGVLTADFAAPRPDRVTSSTKLIIQGLRYELDIVDDQSYSARPLQTFSAIPKELYIDGGYPLATISLEPAPAEAYTLELWTWTPLTKFASGTAQYYFPTGYARFLKYALAMELAPDYDIEPSPQLVKLYADAKAAVENLNLESPIAQIDAAVLITNRSMGRTPYGWLGNYR